MAFGLSGTGAMFKQDWSVLYRHVFPFGAKPYLYIFHISPE